MGCVPFMDILHIVHVVGLVVYLDELIDLAKGTY